MFKFFHLFSTRTYGLFTILFWGVSWTIASHAQEITKFDTSPAILSNSPDRWELEALVEVETGELPIILSAPHGGNRQLLDIPERKGEGLPTGGAGYFTGRDGGTEELARATAEAVRERFGKKPFVVISKVHRKFLDPNRPAEIAFEDPRVKSIYDYYHQSLSRFCDKITEHFHAGVLIDIHGQGTSRETVYRGTRNGLTVARLKSTFGENAHHGPKSLFGMLHERGWRVHPMPLDGKEQSGFTGGYIVNTYGSHRNKPIDAMQLEFGAEYRTANQREKTAAILAEALAEYCEAYLTIKTPKLESKELK